MRRQHRDCKRSSCTMCKPHKRGWDYRWKPRERQLQKEFEKERREHEDK